MSNGESTNPYVGPVPFSTNHSGFFFGRDTEAARLLALAISERIVLLYAQSGAGKSSLINAKMVPDLKQKGYHVLPVARVGGDLPSEVSADKVDNVFVFNTLLSLAETKKGIFGEKKDAKAQIGKTLGDYVRAQGLNKLRKQHWLIFDQFEEIITTHPDQDLEKRKDFFRHLKQMLDEDEFLSLVIVMREDHLAGLDTFVPFLPELSTSSSRYRIERLRRKQALDAVKLPAEKAGRTFADGAAEHLINDLSQERIADQQETRPGEYVEPLFLQLVCFSLWKSLDELKQKRLPEEDKIITQHDVKKYGDIDTALKKFYSDAVRRVAGKTDTSEMAIRRWFGETLITPTGIRAQVDRGLLKSGGLSNRAVDLLVGEEHLIRLEEARGGKWYELSHDRFVKPVLDSNEEWQTGGAGDSRLAKAARVWNALGRDESFLYRGRLLQNAQARYEKNKEAAGPLEEAFLQASERASVKRQWQYRWMITILVLLVLLAGASAGYALYRKGDVEKRWQELDRAHKELEQKSRDEKDLRKWAESGQAEANKQLEEARLQFMRAEAERKRAEEQFHRAEAAGKRAEQQRRLAQERLRTVKDLEERNRKLFQAEQDDYESELLEAEKQAELSKQRIEYLMKVLSTQQVMDYRQFVQSQLAQQTSPAQKLPGCDANGNCTTRLPVVGEIRWKASGGSFEFLDDWGDKNITKVDIPQLSRLKGIFGTTADFKVPFYKGAASQLQKAWAEIEKANLLDQVISWDGSLTIGNYKLPRPSSHSVGTAFDIKVNRSVGDKPLSKDDKVSKVLEIFRANGFRADSIGLGAYHVEYVGTPGTIRLANER